LLQRVAEAVLQRELHEDSNIQQVLQQALAVLGEAEAPVELQVHPDDAALLRESGFAQDARYRVVEDPRMLRGGAQLRAAGSFVDASVEHRLEALMAGLRGELSLPEAPEPGVEPAGDG
jgi:flagellar biosynthesis/type III secretory pathway protein FliH